jgi:tRNA_anti-like
LPAYQISKDYNSNELSADQEYKGKYLDVSGRVVSVTTAVGTPYVILEGAPTGDRVMAEFDSNQDGPLANLTSGENIIFQCIGNGMSLTEASLNNCLIISTSTTSGV